MTASHRLHLLRHLKSSWEDRSLRDHARPLAPRGVTAGQAMQRHLRAQAVEVDLVLCSTATRTRRTWDAVRDGVGGDPEVRFLDEIYEASVATLTGLVRGVDEGVRAVLVIGHNPGIGDLAVELTGDADPVTLRRLVEKYPTGALAGLTLTGPWTGVGAGRCRLDDVVRPRDLPG